MMIPNLGIIPGLTPGIGHGGGHDDQCQSRNIPQAVGDVIEFP